jgi:hypothetical protein
MTPAHAEEVRIDRFYPAFRSLATQEACISARQMHFQKYPAARCDRDWPKN